MFMYNVKHIKFMFMYMYNVEDIKFMFTFMYNVKHIKFMFMFMYNVEHIKRGHCRRLTVNLPGPICVVFISVLQLHCLVPVAGLATGL